MKEDLKEKREEQEVAEEKAVRERVSFEEPDPEESKRMGRGIFFIVALLFIAVICLTEWISFVGGKAMGTGALVILGGITACVLYKKEIKAWFSRKCKK